MSLCYCSWHCDTKSLECPFNSYEISLKYGEASQLISTQVDFVYFIKNCDFLIGPDLYLLEIQCLSIPNEHYRSDNL